MKFLLFFLGALSATAWADAGAGRDMNSIWQTVSMIAIAVAFFYFILWRPQQKRQKEMEAKRNSMQKGDQVTAMGIVGNVDKINEHTVILKMVDGSKIEMLKAAINEVKASQETKKESQS